MHDDLKPITCYWVNLAFYKVILVQMKVAKQHDNATKNKFFYNATRYHRRNRNNSITSPIYYRFSKGVLKRNTTYVCANLDISYHFSKIKTITNSVAEHITLKFKLWIKSLYFEHVRKKISEPLILETTLLQKQFRPRIYLSGRRKKSH